MKYEITTLKDVFDKLPADRIKPCLHELAIAMEQAKAMRELLNAAGKAISGDSVDVDFSWPETSTWIDDGKGKIDLKFMDQDRTELFDYTVQLAGSNEYGKGGPEFRASEKAHRILDAATKAWHAYAVLCDGADRIKAFDVFENLRRARHVA